MIKCIAVDDEKIILDELCGMIARTQTDLLSAFQDPYQALDSIKSLHPDVVFVDIEMPELNGIELAKKIIAFDPQIQVVFVTAYEQYAIEAFNARAIHYLLKPLTEEKVKDVIERVLQAKRVYKPIGQIDQPEINKLQSTDPDRITLKDRDDLIILKIADIIYLKSEQGKTIIVTRNGSFSSRIGLHFFESKLESSDFIRCHRSYLVNAIYITKMIHILGEYKELILEYCNTNIPISRQKVGAVKDWLGI